MGELKPEPKKTKKPSKPKGRAVPFTLFGASLVNYVDAGVVVVYDSEGTEKYRGDMLRCQKFAKGRTPEEIESAMTELPDRELPGK